MYFFFGGRALFGNPPANHRYWVTSTQIHLPISDVWSFAAKARTGPLLSTSGRQHLLLMLIITIIIITNKKTTHNTLGRQILLVRALPTYKSLFRRRVGPGKSKKCCGIDVSNSKLRSSCQHYSRKRFICMVMVVRTTILVIVTCYHTRILAKPGLEDLLVFPHCSGFFLYCKRPHWRADSLSLEHPVVGTCHFQSLFPEDFAGRGRSWTNEGTW